MYFLEHETFVLVPTVTSEIPEDRPSKKRRFDLANSVNFQTGQCVGVVVSVWVWWSVCGCGGQFVGVMLCGCGCGGQCVGVVVSMWV